MAIVLPARIVRPTLGFIFILCGLHDFRYSIGALGMVVMGIAQLLMATPLIKVTGDNQPEGAGMGAAFRVGTLLWLAWHARGATPALGISMVLLAVFQGSRATGTLLMS